MTNEYEVAMVIEIGKAQDVILGQKSLAIVPDSVTGEPNQFFDPETNE